MMHLFFRDKSDPDNKCYCFPEVSKRIAEMDFIVPEFPCSQLSGKYLIDFIFA
jgi:hypothetical protein